MRVPHPHVDDSGRVAYVRGTPVPVRRLWAWHQKGITVETLVKRYPKLGWANILDALSWCYDNEDRVVQELAEEREILNLGSVGMQQEELNFRGRRS